MRSKSDVDDDDDDSRLMLFFPVSVLLGEQDPMEILHYVAPGPTNDPAHRTFCTPNRWGLGFPLNFSSQVVTMQQFDHILTMASTVNS